MQAGRESGGALCVIGNVLKTPADFFLGGIVIFKKRTFFDFSSPFFSFFSVQTKLQKIMLSEGIDFFCLLCRIPALVETHESVFR